MPRPSPPTAATVPDICQNTSKKSADRDPRRKRNAVTKPVVIEPGLRMHFQNATELFKEVWKKNPASHADAEKWLLAHWRDTLLPWVAEEGLDVLRVNRPHAYGPLLEKFPKLLARGAKNRIA
jgi:hypothetical protein